MNSQKNGNLAKVVAFFVITVILVCIVAFASNAENWQFPTNDDDNSGNADNENGETDGNKDVTENPDGNVDGANPDTDTPVVNQIPEYLHYLTGLEIEQSEAYIKPLAFVFNTDSPLYGISSSYLTVEFPTENAGSRYLCYIDNATSLGKLGSIAPTRDYISNIAGIFGGVQIYEGNDSAFTQSTNAFIPNHGVKLDLTSKAGYSYTEYLSFKYSNGNLISALISNSGTNLTMPISPTLPYDFIGYFDDPLTPSAAAVKLILPTDGTKSTELTYSSELGKYVLSKNSANVRDLLNDSVCSYDNVFVLYTDAVTYETENATQTVYEMLSGGKGLYLTKGGYVNISWSVDASGAMTFLDENGLRLTVNRGTTYINFTKSSLSQKTVIL